MQTLRLIFPIFLAILALGCTQQEGDVCETYDPGTGSSQQGDCAVGLRCCQPSGVGRGVCTQPSMCVIDETDAGPLDGSVADAAVDAGEGADGGDDAGADDAGADDAGAEDAGMADAGAEDAGMPDAGATDAGMADAGMADAG